MTRNEVTALANFVLASIKVSACPVNDEQLPTLEAAVDAALIALVYAADEARSDNFYLGL